MPRLPRLEFTASHFAVAYRAAQEVQLLEMKIVLAAPVVDPRLALRVWALTHGINHGAAAGAEFSPASSFARIVSGPLPDRAGWQGPALAWSIEVAAMSPLYLRTYVEAMCDASFAVAQMLIAGSLPTDDSPASVRERTVAAWLDDTTSFPGRFQPVPFQVIESATTRGASVRVVLAGAATDALEKSLREHISVWHGAICQYPALDGGPDAVMSLGPAYARKKRELLVDFPVYAYARKPATDALVNVLASFHARVAPIALVEVAMP